MKLTQGDYFLPRYSHTSSNQHGDRYKRISSKHIKVVRMACGTSDSYGTQQLILLSINLNVPVRYDYDEGKCYIEVVSAEEVRKL
jgi:trimethylamine:corrinoid methyltransferase-like protein